jgi:hypothetical protein
MAYYLYDGKEWEKVGTKFSDPDELFKACRADGMFSNVVALDEYNKKDCYMFFNRTILKFRKQKVLCFGDDKEEMRSLYVSSVPPAEMDEDMRKEIEHEKEIDNFFFGKDEGYAEKKIETVAEKKKEKAEEEPKQETSSEEKKKRGRPKKVGLVTL